MKELKWKDAEQEIKTGIVFLEFFTSWCADCKMMEPIVRNVEKEINGKKEQVKFVKINAEEANFCRNKNAAFQVLKVPSFFVIKDGKSHHIGYEYLPHEILMAAIKNHL